MNRASLLGLTLVLPALAAAFFACQKEDPRPPASDGPGVFNPGSGSGSGSEGGAGDGGANAFASFPGYQATGVTADGDTTYVTLTAHDTTHSGQVVRVDPNGNVTVLVSTAVEPLEPVLGSETLYYADFATGFTSHSVLALNLANVAAGPQPLIVGLSQTPGFAVAGDVIYATEGSDIGTNADVVVLDGGNGNTIGNIPPPFDSAGSVALDATNLYFVGASGDGSELDSVPLVGGPQNPLLTANGVGSIGPVAVLDGFVYFTLVSSNSSVSGVYSVPTIGGAGARIAAPAIPQELAVSETNIYYSDYSTDPPSIYKGALTADAGVDPVLIATGRVPEQIAVGATAVYVAIDEGLLRIPR